MQLLVFGLVLISLGMAIISLSLAILLKKNGKFPETHIGKNKAMKERGIHCANMTDQLERQNYRPVDIQ